jgi:hypothetical protein
MGEEVASDACARLAPRALRRREAAPAPARAVVPHPLVQLDEPGCRCPFVLAVAGARGPEELGEVPLRAVGTGGHEDSTVEVLGLPR